MTIANDIRHWLARYNYTQEEAAKQLGVPRVTLHRWVNDKAKPNSLAIDLLARNSVIDRRSGKDRRKI